MSPRSIPFRLGAVIFAAALMGGYVAYQAAGGDVRLFAGSKSAPVGARSRGAPTTAPSTAPATLPAKGQPDPPKVRIFAGSKSAAVFTRSPSPSPPPEIEQATQAVPPSEEKPRPQLMPSSKYDVVFKPLNRQQPATQPSK